MKAYNIEFFNKNLECTFNTLATVDKLEIDYLAPEKTSINILKTDRINVQDIVYIHEFPEYVGVVDSITQEEKTTTVLIKPFVTVFEQPIMFNTSLQKGEVEFQVGWNHLYWGPVSYDNNIFFDIYLKPEKYKFGLFNAGADGQFGFNNIENINRDKIQFIAKCGHSMFDESRNVVYGPRVCVGGTVSQPRVPSGTFLYYMVDNSGKTAYGEWDETMIKDDEWFRKNVQMCCSPSFIFVADGDSYYAYSAYRQRSVEDEDMAYWSFFGKDRHGRFFLGVCHTKTTAGNVWDMLFRSCGITELAFIGGGKVEDNIGEGTFKDMGPTDKMMCWYRNEMVTKGSRSLRIGDTFAFYEELKEDEEYKAPVINVKNIDVQLNPDVSLEDTIKNIIHSNWVSRSASLIGFSDDETMNLPIVCNGYNEDLISSTKKWSLSIKPDNQNAEGTVYPVAVVNLYSTIIQQAFKIYRIAVTSKIIWNTDTDWPWGNKNIIDIKIGIPQEVVHIEADLPNVKIKELIDGKANNDVNKLIIYDGNGFNDSVIYYRYKNAKVTDYWGDKVGYGQRDYDRIYPVVQEIVIVDSSTKDGDTQKDFKTLAWEQAASTFDPIKWNNYIELEMYEPPKIQLGQLCYIHHDGKIYETVLTGIKDGDVKTLIFGAYREDYTKSMIVNNYNRILEIKKASKNAYTARSTNLGKDY